MRIELTEEEALVLFELFSGYGTKDVVDRVDPRGIGEDRG
jgi:hypothetical protein